MSVSISYFLKLCTFPLSIKGIYRMAAPRSIKVSVAPEDIFLREIPYSNWLITSLSFYCKFLSSKFNFLSAISVDRKTIWFGLASFFNDISTFVCYLTPNPSLLKNNSGDIQPIAGRNKGVLTLWTRLLQGCNPSFSHYVPEPPTPREKN